MFLTDHPKEYETLHEIEEVNGSIKKRSVNHGYGPLMWVATTIAAMAAGALMSSRMINKG